jgi:hypothetical protein
MINMPKYFHFPDWKTLYYDIVWSLFSAIIGSLCFSVFANWVLADNREIFLVPFLIVWFFGLLFSFIPAIVFGGALSFVLRSEPRILKKKTYGLGGIIGGLSAIIIDVGVLRFSNIDLSTEVVNAFAAVFIAVFCGMWTAGKIYTSLAYDVSEATK